MRIACARDGCGDVRSQARRRQAGRKLAWSRAFRPVTFGGECGIRDTRSRGDAVCALGERQVDGRERGKRPGAGDEMAARVWHQGHWMVDLHDAPGPQSPVMHTGQMCFDAAGADYAA